MDSAELLMLLDGLQASSNFRTWAERGGEWEPELVVQVRIANELMASRADGQGYMPDWIKTPGDQQAELERDELRLELYAQAQAELRGETRKRKRKAVT